MMTWWCYILCYQEQLKKRDTNYTCAEDILLLWKGGAIRKNQMVKIEKGWGRKNNEGTGHERSSVWFPVHQIIQDWIHLRFKMEVNECILSQLLHLWTQGTAEKRGRKDYNAQNARKSAVKQYIRELLAYARLEQGYFKLEWRKLCGFSPLDKELQTSDDWWKEDYLLIGMNLIIDYPIQSGKHYPYTHKQQQQNQHVALIYISKCTHIYVTIIIQRRLRTWNWEMGG